MIDYEFVLSAWRCVSLNTRLWLQIGFTPLFSGCMAWAVDIKQADLSLI